MGYEQGETPDFVGDGVAVWVYQDKNGKHYLNIKLAGHSVVRAFRNEKAPANPAPKQEEQHATKVPAQESSLLF